MTEPLTVCTVSFNSAPYLRLNRRLGKALNPTADLRWIVAENSPADSSARLEHGEPGFDIIQGAGPGHIASYHHTLALRSCIERADTRFVLVLDPDLFVIRRDWVATMLAHMQTRGLAILGVPWHPQSKGKYRYFPAVHFSIFDTAKFDKAAIDFLPDYPDGEHDPRWPEGWHPDRDYFALSTMARWLARLPQLKARRRHYTDTGSRLYKKFVTGDAIRFEVLDPVFDAERERQRLSRAGRLLERVLPDELCYVPKGYDGANNAPFLSGIAGGETPKAWEQFLWQSAPFCFHVRRNLGPAQRGLGNELEIAERIVDALVAREASPTRA